MKKNGFTLVELLAVIAIISILATVAVSAVISIYNSSIKKTMVLQENNISDVSKTYLEDFCLDPLPGSEYVCPSTYTNKHYICLSNLKDKRNQYIEGATYKNKECNGIIIFEMDKYGTYSKPKTYLYCDYDSSSKKYNYVTDETLNISDYPVCNIASVIDDTTTSTTATTTKPVQTDCTYNGTLKQGAEYVNGQYTYIYKKKHNGFSWVNMSEDGWGVTLTDKDSTDAVTSKVCTYINNKPIVSMSYMFGGSKATTLDLSNFDTSNVTDMSKMFQSSKATTLDVSNFDTSNITDMSRMFDRSQATTLDLSNFNTSKVIDMSYMFYYSQATTLDVSNFDTSKVTGMNFMFSYSKATTIDVSNFDTSKVTNMSSMFSDSKATILDVSNFDTSNVTNMRHMFSSSQVTTLDLSNFDTSKVTNMSNMFAESQVIALDLSNFDTSNVTNMSNMFYNSKATTIDVSNFNTSNVTTMSIMFHQSQATTIDVSNFNTSNVTNMSYMFSYSQATTLDVSKFDTSKVTDMSSMFYLSKATILDVSNFDTSNVTSMSSMFYRSQATTLDVSKFDTSNVTNMRYMFYSSQVKILDLSNFDTSKVTDMQYMFERATNLKTIYVSNKFNTNKVTSSNSMFYNCTNLVGGAGTKYNSSYVDKTYARIDGGTSNPGYFTSIPEPNSFSSDSWMTIAKAVKSGNISKYNVGDTKSVTLTTYGTHTLRIANTSTPSECSTSGFSQSACGFVVEFADIITTHNMNGSSTNKGGWPASDEMYTFVNNDIYNALPNELRNVIIDTTVVSSHGSEDTANFTSTDKLYLLAPGEVWSNWKTNTSEGPSYDTAKGLTRTLDYYTAQGVTISNYSGAIKKNGSSAAVWWLRAALSDANSSFFSVGSSGVWRRDSASTTFTGTTFGVSPAFRIG